MNLFHFALASNLQKITPAAAIADTQPKANTIGAAYDRIVVPTVAALATAQDHGLQGRAADNTGGVDKGSLPKPGGKSGKLQPA